MNRRTSAADTLTPHELAILERLTTGLSDQQIADELMLSVHTIKWYNRQIYSKLGVSSRTQAIARAAGMRAPVRGVDDPARMSASAAPLSVGRYALPAPSSLFVGRSHELAEITRLLSTARLLTLTGTGGTGKTQLALRVAAHVAPAFGDGVCFVDLAPLSDHTLVAKAIAGALGVLEQQQESLRETLKRALAPQALLLLLDNFEHVIDAAPVVSALLLAAPRLHVLATSRESLRLTDEQEYPVPPLSLPPAEQDSVHGLMASEAGLFFVRRAQRALPHFEPTSLTAPVIGHICRRLEGLPLALELAAARCKLFTPEALLEQLAGASDGSLLRALAGGSRDSPPRLRTLRDSIAWSYDLLDAEEQMLFARLAVFHGGCSLEAIEGICGDGLSVDPVDGLASLVEKNLVQQQQEDASGELRFVMLEMIQEYARERLSARGDAETLRRRHAEYFVAWAERAEPALRRAGYEHWSRLLTMNLDNLRAVLEWSLSGGDLTFGVRLAGALCVFWYGNGYHVEGQRWTQRLLERLEDVSPTYHAKFLMSAGHMAFLRDLEAGRPLFERARARASEAGDHLQLAWALAFLGYTLLPDPTAARPLVEESLALFRTLAYQSGVAQALNILGEIARFNGDDDQARSAYEDCLAVCQQTGERRRIVFMCSNLAFLAAHTGDFARAKLLGCQGLRLAREMDSDLHMATTLATVAGALGMLGHGRRAIRLFGASESALERMGAFHQLNDRPEVDVVITAVRAQLDEATVQAALEEGRMVTLQQAVAEALDDSDATA